MRGRNLFQCLSVLTIVLAVQSNVWGIVTSDNFFTHVVPTGTLAWGLDLDGVVLIEMKGENVYTGQQVSSWGTGAVLAGGEYILTAAHVVEAALYTGPLSTVLIDER